MQGTCSDFNRITISALSRENATCLLKIIVTYPRDMREKWKAHFTSTCTDAHEIWFLASVTVRRIRRDTARRSFHHEDARQNRNYLSAPCTHYKKNVSKGRRRCVCVCMRSYTRAMLRFLLYLQHVPRGMKNECFQAPAPFVPVDVCAWATHVSYGIIRTEVMCMRVRQDYIVRSSRRRWLTGHNCILVSP